MESSALRSILSTDNIACMAQESELSEVVSFNSTSATVLLCAVLQINHLMSHQLKVQIQ